MCIRDRGQFGQGSRQEKKGLQNHRNPEVGCWEARVRGPQLDSEKGGFWQQKRSGDKGEPSSYARAELSGKLSSEGGTSLPDRVEATMGVIMYMAALAADENTRMRREELHRVETL